MSLYYQWLVLAPVLALLTMSFGKLSVSRWVVVLSFVWLVGAYGAELWTPAHFAAVGCTGDMTVGIDCPDGTIVTKFALLHQVWFMVGKIYFFMILPLVFLAIFFMERRARRAV